MSAFQTPERGKGRERPTWGRCCGCRMTCQRAELEVPARNFPDLPKPLNNSGSARRAGFPGGLTTSKRVLWVLVWVPVTHSGVMMVDWFD